ncbi:hypothetical protein CHM34_17315 [Paludifilum halophilum]|uniref:Uncharacterized protein n=1 Tax=Paludifilum halophilum TaxID=1642702 RepID=A0A235B2N2_9BACL|nr:hypothetical protein CHM34_17315 [Paludifilum halophilum]
MIIQKNVDSHVSQYRSMLAFYKSWYHESKDMTQEYVQELKRSIQYFPGHVLNHISLSISYKEHGQEEKSRYHRVKGSIILIRKVTWQIERMFSFLSENVLKNIM